MLRAALTEVHMREELLHQIMDAAYISEYPRIIEWAVNSFGTSKAVY
jgi:hypothetical protein